MKVSPNNFLERTELLIGKEKIDFLKRSKVMVVGLGGVGSYAAEALARAGIGNLILIDGDIVEKSNINRQLVALHSTIGLNKTDVMGARVMDINPEVNLKTIHEFLEPHRIGEIISTEKVDVVLDCIDSLSPKISLLKECKRQKVRCVSVMGAGGKMDPTKVVIRDISSTHSCLLAQKIRKRLKEFNINKGIRAVFSTEIQNSDSLKLTDGSNYKKSFYGTISYMPAIFGLTAASEALRLLFLKME
jgi:tRNA A37 threonylcarbamoyladenosine dehydratase